MIRESPSHIYHSALPLSPSSSWLRGCYEAEAAGEVRVLMGLPERWDTCSRTIHFEGTPKAFAHCGDTIAVGIGSDVVLLDAVTGIRKSVLSGHRGEISSLASSVDGTLLVSRGDKAVNLWDIQTGGVIKTLGRDTPIVPTSTSPRQWDIDGHQTGPFCGEEGRPDGFAYTSDGTRFVSCGGRVVTVRDSESGAVVVKLDAPEGENLSRCCISPDGRFVACKADTIIYVWDITTSEPRLVGHLEHSNSITFLAFPSSLVSGSSDGSVKFWQTSSLLAGPLTTDNIAGPHGSTTIESVNLFTEDGTIVTSDSSGVVKTWDLKAGKLKSSFLTPAKGKRATHLAGDTLIVVWWTGGECHIWDVYKGQLLRSFHSHFYSLWGLKISGDGSKLFGFNASHIQAVSMRTGEDAGSSSRFENTEGYSFFVRGSMVGIDNRRNRGWDFGGSGVSEFEEFPNRPRFDLVDWPIGRKVTPCWIEDRVTKRQVFRLPERYTKYGTQVEWDGRYLLVLTRPAGEVTVIDFDPVCPR